MLPNALPGVEIREKILSKQTVEESQLQLNILDKVSELNEILITKKPKQLFDDDSCRVLYNKLIELQTAQNFAGLGWKVVCYATLIPMTNQIFIFTSCVFHTRKVPIYFSWSKSDAKMHSDLKLTSDVMSNVVEQQKQSPLVQKPTPNFNVTNDWPIDNNLERLDQSGSSSIDSGRTLVEPFPVMNAIADISRNDFDETTNDSYLDISFLTPRRKLNLSKKQKIDILEAPNNSTSPSSNHSTPMKAPRVGRLSMNMKRGQQNIVSRTASKPNQPNKESNRNFMAKFLNRWFRSQIANITDELQEELNRMN